MEITQSTAPLARSALTLPSRPARRRSSSAEAGRRWRWWIGLGAVGMLVNALMVFEILSAPLTRQHHGVVAGPSDASEPGRLPLEIGAAGAKNAQRQRAAERELPASAIAEDDAVRLQLPGKLPPLRGLPMGASTDALASDGTPFDDPVRVRAIMAAMDLVESHLRPLCERLESLPPGSDGQKIMTDALIELSQIMQERLGDLQDDGLTDRDRSWVELQAKTRVEPLASRLMAASVRLVDHMQQEEDQETLRMAPDPDLETDLQTDREESAEDVEEPPVE